MKLCVRQIELRSTRYQTRQPFGFGRSLVEAAPYLMARATVEVEGNGQAVGFAGDLLVPRWFDKNPELSAEADAAQLVHAAETAAARFRSHGHWPTELFALWHSVFSECVDNAQGGPPELVRGFGVALIERALIDACCRALGLSFVDALRANVFQIDAARVHPALAGWKVERDLPLVPLQELRVRHTIGLVDPLHGLDQSPQKLKSDGLPHTLEDHIRIYGLDAFKIKLRGEPAADLERLNVIADVLLERAPAELLLSVDANEQYADLAQLLLLVKGLEAGRNGRYILDHLAYFEQPLPRARAFQRTQERGLRDLSEYAPVILDESDATSSSFERAIACGYRGVSIKNCKGVFRAVLHRGLCERLGHGLFLSAEDLTTLPILSLQQDLATVAALGLTHVERNGHHYFERLNHLTVDERTAALREHPDLYCNRGAGPELAIQRGRVRVASLHCPGFGYATQIDFERLTPISECSLE